MESAGGPIERCCARKTHFETWLVGVLTFTATLSFLSHFVRDGSGFTQLNRGTPFPMFLNGTCTCYAPSPFGATLRRGSAAKISGDRSFRTKEIQETQWLPPGTPMLCPEVQFTFNISFENNNNKTRDEYFAAWVRTNEFIGAGGWSEKRTKDRKVAEEDMICTQNPWTKEILGQGCRAGLPNLMMIRVPSPGYARKSFDDDVCWTGQQAIKKNQEQHVFTMPTKRTNVGGKGKSTYRATGGKNDDDDDAYIPQNQMIDWDVDNTTFSAELRGDDFDGPLFVSWENSVVPFLYWLLGNPAGWEDAGRGFTVAGVILLANVTALFVILLDWSDLSESIDVKESISDQMGEHCGCVAKIRCGPKLGYTMTLIRACGCGRGFSAKEAVRKGKWTPGMHTPDDIFQSHRRSWGIKSDLRNGKLSEAEAMWTTRTIPNKFVRFQKISMKSEDSDPAIDVDDSEIERFKAKLNAAVGGRRRPHADKDRESSSSEEELWTTTIMSIDVSCIRSFTNTDPTLLNAVVRQGEVRGIVMKQLKTCEYNDFDKRQRKLQRKNFQKQRTEETILLENRKKAIENIDWGIEKRTCAFYQILSFSEFDVVSKTSFVSSSSIQIFGFNTKPQRLLYSATRTRARPVGTTTDGIGRDLDWFKFKESYDVRMQQQIDTFDWDDPVTGQTNTSFRATFPEPNSTFHYEIVREEDDQEIIDFFDFFQTFPWKTDPSKRLILPFNGADTTWQKWGASSHLDRSQNLTIETGKALTLSPQTRDGEERVSTKGGSISNGSPPTLDNISSYQKRDDLECHYANIGYGYLMLQSLRAHIDEDFLESSTVDGMQLSQVTFRTGWYVDYIGFEYINGTIIENRKKAMTGGKEQKSPFVLQAGEYICAVSGLKTADDDSCPQLAAIRVHTNTGRCSNLYGNSRGERLQKAEESEREIPAVLQFKFDAKPGFQICGITRTKSGFAEVIDVTCCAAPYANQPAPDEIHIQRAQESLAKDVLSHNT